MVDLRVGRLAWKERCVKETVEKAVRREKT